MTTILAVVFLGIVASCAIFSAIQSRKSLQVLIDIRKTILTAFYDKLLAAKQKYALEQERQLKDQRHFAGRG